MGNNNGHPAEEMGDDNGHPSEELSYSNGHPSKEMGDDNGHPLEEMNNNNGHTLKEMGDDNGQSSKEISTNNGHPSKEMDNNNGNPPLKNRLNIKLFGDAWTGKTELIQVYQNGVYEEYTGVTLGFDFTSKELTVHNIATKVFIWDHPGRKRLRFLLPKSIPGADGIFLLYDVTNIKTFHNLPEWLKTLRSLNPGATIFIIGAKSDLIDKKEVSSETGLKFARSENLEFFECSAKTRENLNYVFEHMVLRLLQKKGVLPYDQIEGKSLEHQKNKERFDSDISEEEILKVEQKITPVEDTPKFQKEEKLSSEVETDCLRLKKVDDTDTAKGNDNNSAQSNKVTSSELNEVRNYLDNSETVQPEAKELGLSEEEMQHKGMCPKWFA